MNQTIKISIVMMFFSAMSSCKTGGSSSQNNDIRGQVAFVMEFFKPDNIRRVAQDQYNRLKISASSRIFKFNMLDSASISGRYKYELQKRGDGMHIRSDQWRLGLGLIPGMELVGGPIPVNLNLNLSINSDVVFIRVFQDKNKAGTALPRTLLDLPLNADKANQMSLGEKVVLPLTMGIRVGPAVGWNVSHMGLSSSAGVLWSGRFQLEISRISQEIFGLKIIPSEKWGFYLNSFAGYELDHFGYAPFNLFSFDKVLTRELGLDVFKFNATRIQQGRSSQLEYVYNLADEDAANAFNHALNSVMRISSQSKVLLQGDLASLSDLYFLDFGPSETLSSLDQNRDILDRRVSVVTAQENNYYGKTHAMQWGTKLLRFSQGSSLSYNEISKLDSNQLSSTMLFHHLILERKRSSFWSPVREAEDIQAAGIQSVFETSEAGKSSFMFNWNKTDGNFSGAEFRTYVNAVKNILNFGANDPLLNLRIEQLPRVTAKLKIAINDQVFAKMRSEALGAPNQFRQRLMYIMNDLYLRFDKRFGVNTPAPAQNFVDKVKSSFTTSGAQLKNLMDSAMRLRWGSASQKAFRESFEVIEANVEDDAIYMLGDLLKLMKSQPAAVEIVPALILQLADDYKLKSDISFQLTSEKQVISSFVENSGINESSYEELLSNFHVIGRIDQ